MVYDGVTKVKVTGGLCVDVAEGNVTRMAACVWWPVKNDGRRMENDWWRRNSILLFLLLKMKG
jgi:hypothetical protein